MAKKKQTKRHKPASRKRAARPPPAPADGVPKYLSEPNMPIRRIAFWILKDSRLNGSREDGLNLGAVYKMIAPALTKLLSSKQSKNQYRALRIISSLRDQDIRQQIAEMSYQSTAMNAFVTEKLAELQASIDQDTGQGMRPEKMTEFTETALRKVFADLLPSDATAAKGEPA